VAVLLGIVAAVLGWYSLRQGQESGQAVMRLSMNLAADAPLVLAAVNPQPNLALSPDGTQLVYVSPNGDTTRLYLRPLDRTEGTPLSGTEGAYAPFFSPDGQWVGFFAEGKLKKVPVQGGLPVSLCDAAGGSRGASWADDGTIIFSPGTSSGLMRVSAAGGEPEVLTTPNGEKGERTHRWPEVLPGAKAVVFVVGDVAQVSYYLDAQIAVQSFETGERKILPVRGTFPRYLPSGHLLFASEGGLFAASFDQARLEITGPAIPVLDDVRHRNDNGAAQFAVSRDGSLIHVAGGSQETKSGIAVYDRRGTARPLAPQKGLVRDSSLSPDGRRLALSVLSGPNRDIWVLDLTRDTLTRLTFGEGESIQPMWTPDGKRIVFAGVRGGKRGRGLYWKLADGSRSEEELVRLSYELWPGSWSPDGKLLAYVVADPSNGGDIWVLPLDAERKPWPFKQTKFWEQGPQISPDGRWLAYVSNESGRFEIYVEAFPGPGGKWQISKQVAGEARPGAIARWAPNGRELFFQSGNRLMSVAVETQPTFSAGAPRQLFELRGAANFVGTADGQRFLFQETTEEQLSISQLNVILNWSEELKQRVPTAK
jgi:serine/threonine-protein kinase